MEEELTATMEAHEQGLNLLEQTDLSSSDWMIESFESQQGRSLFSTSSYRDDDLRALPEPSFSISMDSS